jgi:eukaryotic-like serine/threonine-protein kinase
MMPGPSQIAHYRITSKLGEGGMGAVYRATDTKLNRDVAIKVLPPAFAEDAARMQRFEREAQVLASLNHPNIAAIYGIEQGALVMELVEGADLRGPLPLEDAIPIARQIAVGLEAAHERGIIHRDLKPANIKVTPDGTVKLLDFGLAKATEQSAAASAVVSPTMSPTLSLAMTQAGMILGTAAYMSPEQARGKPVDKRADIWAFGVVLYELLTGKMLFGGGETVTDTLASVVKDTPDLAQLPAGTPPYLLALLERCLRKDVNMRLRDIGEARILLENPPASVALPSEAAPRRRATLPWIVAAVLGFTTIVSVAVWLRRPAVDPRTYRLSVLPPEKTDLSTTSLPALSPDGRYLSFTAEQDGKTQLWVRDLGALESRMLPGTDAAHDAFWAPDSRWLGFFASGKLKKVDIAGGPAVNVCDASNGRGGTWSQNGVIVYTPAGADALWRVPAGGGTPVPLTRLDEAAGDASHRFPWFLPDGRHYLYTVRGGDEAKSGIYAGDLESTQRLRIVAAISNVAYAPPGYILFGRERTLMAQPFDAGALRTTGDAFPVAGYVDFAEARIQSRFSVSQTGILAYTSGGARRENRIAWLDRSGKEMGTLGPPLAAQRLRISPDGGTVAVDRFDAAVGTFDLWLHDLARATDSRFTFDSANDRGPVWSPDGSRIAFLTTRNGKAGIYQKAANGAGKEELIVEAPSGRPSDWSPDGRFLVYSSTTPQTQADIWVLPFDGDRKPYPFLQTRFNERIARFSPDGHWLAYDSDESGRFEVYVQAFPAKEGKWQLSSGGGTRPVWSRNGKELFFLSAENRMIAVDVRSGAKFEHGTPRMLFEAHLTATTEFDVAADAQRFLMVRTSGLDFSPPVTVVLNWLAGVKP